MGGPSASGKSGSSASYKPFKTYAEMNNFQNNEYKRYTLSNFEEESIREYSDMAYSGINQYLRGKTKYISSENADYLDGLTTALDKAHLSENIVVYRGLGNSFLQGRNPEDMVGAVITDKGFMSTSINEHASFDGANKIVISAPKGTSAMGIKNMSEYGNEQEVLFNKNTSIKITGVKEDPTGNYNHIFYAKVVKH